MYVNNDKIKKPNKRMDKLPFAVFISPQNINENAADYKEIFTDIISDRIQEKYR